MTTIKNLNSLTSLTPLKMKETIATLKNYLKKVIKIKFLNQSETKAELRIMKQCYG